MKNFKKNKNTGGYTIIETMIALTIFLIVIVIGVGALLNAHLVNKKSQDMRSIMDSLNFSMDDMSRSIRTGYNYHCLIKGNSYYPSSDFETPVNCLRTGFGIAFESSEGVAGDNTDQWVYYIQNGKLYKSTDGLASSVQMTPDQVVLNENAYNFSIHGALSGEKKQPLVIMRLVGKITSNNVSTPFSLQTLVSQRLSDE